MLRIKSALVLFTLLLISPSCVKDLDFDQVEELKFETPLRVSLVNLELSQDNFFDDNDEVISLLHDESEIHIRDFISHSDNKSIVIDTYFYNDFNTDFNLLLELYNEEMLLVYSTEPLLAPSNTDDVHYQIVVNEENFDNFMDAYSVKVSIQAIDTSRIFPLMANELKMQSSISFLYQY